MQKKLGVALSLFTIFLLFLLGAFPTFLGLTKNSEVYQCSYSSSCDILDGTFSFLKTGEGGVLKEGVTRREVMERFEARLVFTEEVDGVVNYYCYSEKIKCSSLIKGKKINLHFAERGVAVKVGTPLIFGSF